MINFLKKTYWLYRDGFAQMTVGRTLWTVIIIKLIIIFAVLKLFFFPDFLKQHSKDGDKAGLVSNELVKRSFEAFKGKKVKR